LVLPPLVVDSIIYSSAIALLGTGLTLAYMTTKVPNFAHGTVAMTGLYLCLTSVRVWHSNPYFFLPVAFLVGGLSGLCLYLLVLKPLIGRGASLVVLMIATIGFDLFLFSLLNIYADYLSNAFGITSRSFFLRDADFRISQAGIFVVTPPLPGILIVSLISIVLLTGFLHLGLTRTKFGVAMRATVENPALAGVVGVNVNLVYTISWFLSGGLAGIAGMFVGLFLAGNTDLGNRLIPVIFAASIVGGLGNVYGALLGGFTVGLSEILGTFQLQSLFPGSNLLVYQPLVPIAFIVITLLLAPSGLTGVDRKLLLIRLRAVFSWLRSIVHGHGR